ncbi:L,D-transpeptidase family protein [Lentzea sp. NPDC003310]|uniref:L,D-transpeptidase family protein n=1 Tax=Lentzea sp. NPDC003310 TaxID=3154447 RepID=UPI0033A4B0F4
MAATALAAAFANGSPYPASADAPDLRPLAFAGPAAAGSSVVLGPPISRPSTTPSTGPSGRPLLPWTPVPRPAAPWFADRVGNAAQVISVVGAGGSDATLSTWQRSGSGWGQVLGGVAAKVGAPGISSSYGESSSATPAGVFGITGAFGRQADPGAGVSYFRADSSDWWVSDVNSPLYNTHQRCARGTCPFNESKSENLAEQGAVYDYALVMGVNEQRVPGGGSAFFVHVTNGAATAGCVAIPADVLVSVMRWVRPGTVIALTPR